jgi:hypothetical protein
VVQGTAAQVVRALLLAGNVRRIDHPRREAGLEAGRNEQERRALNKAQTR